MSRHDPFRPTTGAVFREGLPVVVFTAAMMLVAGAVLPAGNAVPTALGVRPIASETTESSSSPDPTSTVDLTPSPTAEPQGGLASVAWAKTENIAGQAGGSGSFSLLFGRLDGRTFRFTTSGPVHSARPADSGLVLGWWWDGEAAATIVNVFDTSNGNVSELLQTPTHIYSAGIAPSADAWYWVPSVDKGRHEPPYGASDGLWRQSLPSGTPTRVADVGDDPAEIQVAVDGASVLISTAEPSTDFGPMHYRVWYREGGKVVVLPTTEYSPVGLLGNELIVDGTWAQPAELFAINLADGSMRVLPTGADFFTPGIFRGADGSPLLVYAGSDKDGRYALFVLRPGQDSPVKIVSLEEPWPPTDEVGLLARSGRWGGVNALGSVALFAFGSPSIDPDVSGSAPRLLISLKDGTTESVPTPENPREVTK